MRFVSEDAFQSKKQHFLPQVDYLDIGCKVEKVLAATGQPSMLQLPLQACYALTVHKTQATLCVMCL